MSYFFYTLIAFNDFGCINEKSKKKSLQEYYNLNYNNKAIVRSFVRYAFVTENIPSITAAGIRGVTSERFAKSFRLIYVFVSKHF